MGEIHGETPYYSDLPLALDLYVYSGLSLERQKDSRGCVDLVVDLGPLPDFVGESLLRGSRYVIMGSFHSNELSSAPDLRDRGK